jgi:hypothetical protein
LAIADDRCGVAGRGDAEPITLRVSLQIPAFNPIMGRGVVLFKQQLERETEGTLRIEIFETEDAPAAADLVPWKRSHCGLSRSRAARTSMGRVPAARHGNGCR